jgi:hypothetical protein
MSERQRLNVGRGLFRIAFCAVLAAGCRDATAADFKPLNKGKALALTGDIEKGDEWKFWAAVKASNDKGVVSSASTSTRTTGTPAPASSSRVHALPAGERIATVIDKKDVRVSICAMIFASGHQKTLYGTSKLGVHSADHPGANEIADEDEGDRAATLALARMMKLFGAPDRIVVKMIMQPPVGSAASVNAADLDGWGVEILHIIPGAWVEPEGDFGRWRGPFRRRVASSRRACRLSTTGFRADPGGFTN